MSDPSPGPLYPVSQAWASSKDIEDRWNLLVQHVKDYAILFIDPQGRVSSWNVGAERILGYTEAEILGRDAAIFFTPEDRRAGLPERELATAAATGTFQDENWAVRKDGSRFWASGVTTGLRDPAGELRGYMKIFRDLTERRQMEEELARRVEERTAELRASQERALQAERLAAIGLTITGLAHEGRNALQRGQTYLDRLRWRLEKDPAALALVAEAEKALDDLRRLYDDVRGYAAPIHLAYRRCDLADVWRQAWADLAAAREGRDARLDEPAGGADRTCEADPFRLGQVFRNLFDNALAACPDPVVITLEAADDAVGGRPAVRVTVRDNGPGLAAEARDRLFEPFYTTKAHGTGLGMAIARRVLEAHGGRIAVADAPGPGAMFLLTIPRSRA